MNPRPLAIVLSILGISAAQGQEVTLAKLATSLREVRALPEGTPTGLRCPTSTDELLAHSRQDLLTILGRPDAISKNSSASSTTEIWTYFLASPQPTSQRGGGFPELAFSLAGNDRVTKVSCNLAR